MTTLLLRLAGPIQAWGTQDRFDRRFTDREPSKSGVVGLLCAALGRPRIEPVDDLAALRMGARVDAEGVLRRDYHTAGGGDASGVMRASGSLSKNAVVSHRYYLASADFVVGLSGDEALLGALAEALRHPVHQLYLGRKSMPPGVPVVLPGGGMRPGVDLVEALASEPWPSPLAPLPRDMPSRLRFVIECGPDEPGTELRMDQPRGAAFETRRFAPRFVRTEFRELGTAVPLREDDDVPVATNPEPAEP